VYRLAWFHPTNPVSLLDNPGFPHYRAFFEELRRLGYVEGKNLVVERYSAGGRSDRYSDLAREIVRTQPDAIFLLGARVAPHFKAATSTVPIIGIVSDPIGYGIVTNIARPGGNITGIAVDAGSEIQGKFLELLREAVPNASRIGFLIPRETWDLPYGRAMREVAQRQGILLLSMGLNSPIDEAEYRRVFREAEQDGVDAVVVANTAENSAHSRLVVDWANESRIPAIYPGFDYVEKGGLMAYALDLVHDFRVAAEVIARVLRGENPGDIPFQQSTKFNLKLNLKTARALNLTFPPTLLALADEVIE
jgi:putative tryptophan/tyrosine transport system substrate-binding protein